MPVAWIVGAVMLLHLVWGLLLLESPTAADATPVHLLEPFPHTVAGGLLLLTAGGAALALLRLGSAWALLGLFPQQAIMVVSAEGALEAMVLSQYADGVLRDRAFIVADQLPVVLLAALHSGAVLLVATGVLLRLMRRHDAAA